MILRLISLVILCGQVLGQPGYGNSGNIVPYNGGSSSGNPYGNTGGIDPFPTAMPDMAKLVKLEVQCSDNSFRVHVEFDKPFGGIVFAKGYYTQQDCVYVTPGSNQQSYNFIIGYTKCGSTTGGGNGAVGSGGPYGGAPAPSSGEKFMESVIIIQYDPNIQEKWDIARAIRCEWYDSYEKVVSFKTFNVDNLDVVTAKFVGDNVGAWLQIQQGKGPYAGEVNGIVSIGNILTIVIGINDPKNEFDVLPKSCLASDGKSAPIQLVDDRGCIVRTKLMGPFQKIRNFGTMASAVAYSYFQAFKFPDSMEVHIQCVVQICRGQCMDLCSGGGGPNYGGIPATGQPSGPPIYGSNPPPSVSYVTPANPAYPPVNIPANPYGQPPPGPDTANYPAVGTPRSLDDDKKSSHRRRRAISNDTESLELQHVLRVVSLNDLTFLPERNNNTLVYNRRFMDSSSICMSTPGFAIGLVILLALLILACLTSIILCLRIRTPPTPSSAGTAYDNPEFLKKKLAA